MSGFPATGETLTPAPGRTPARSPVATAAGRAGTVTRGEVELIRLPPATDEPTGLVERTRRVLVAALGEVPDWRERRRVLSLDAAAEPRSAR